MIPAQGETPKKAKIIKANTLLQAKVGRGPLDEKVVRRCQTVIDNNKADFPVLAREYLQRLHAVLMSIQQEELKGRAALQALAEPVMQLKAHAGMFKYPLISSLAGIMLSFLESVQAIDDDVIDIVSAHHKTLKTLIIKRMEGDGSSYGEALKEELSEACQRYFARQSGSV